MSQPRIRKSPRLIQNGYYIRSNSNRVPNVSYYEATPRRKSGRHKSQSTRNDELTSVGDPDEAAGDDHWSSSFYSNWMKNDFAPLILILLLLLSVWLLHLFVASFFSLLAPAVPPPLNNISEDSPGGVQPSLDNSFMPALPDRDAPAVPPPLNSIFDDSPGGVQPSLETSSISAEPDRYAVIYDYQAEIQSVVASLKLKMELLEAENAKLSQELSSIKVTPPPVPPPDNSSFPVDHLTPEQELAMEKWFSAHVQELQPNRPSPGTECARPRADRMPDFALESHGGSVISSRCSKTYISFTVTVFGFPLWNLSEGPRTVIQGHPMLLPGKCWAFHGGQGTLLISLSQPVSITSVTLDHLPRYNAPTGRIDSAPRDFKVFGMNNENEAGTLLGMFTYDQDGEPTQTFELSSPSNIHRFVKLQVLSNWGQEEFTCLYRFRVHGKVAST